MTTALGFYAMMNYPLPLRSEFFAYQQTQSWYVRPLQAFWSRLEPPSEQMQVYVDLIKKRQWIRQYIPGVQSVYLANSITFNALRDNSNIDFFIVTWPRRIRTTIVLVKIVFWCINSREHHRKEKKMRFSADFFVTQDEQDLSRILLSPSDPYLVYRLAHLVPVYHRDFVLYDTIYDENMWLQYYLPNFSSRQTIFLWIDVVTGVGRLKRWSERGIYSMVGSLIELLVKYLWKWVLWWKRYRLPVLAAHILVWPGLYKSYDDKRKWYALQREVFKKTQKK